MNATLCCIAHLHRDTSSDFQHNLLFKTPHIYNKYHATSTPNVTHIVPQLPYRASSGVGVGRVLTFTYFGMLPERQKLPEALAVHLRSSQENGPQSAAHTTAGPPPALGSQCQSLAWRSSVRDTSGLRVRVSSESSCQSSTSTHGMSREAWYLSQLPLDHGSPQMKRVP